MVVKIKWVEDTPATAHSREVNIMYINQHIRLLYLYRSYVLKYTQKYTLDNTI